MRYVWVGLMVLMLGSGLAACGRSTSETPDVSNRDASPIAQAPASPASPSVTPSTATSIKLGSFSFNEIYEIGAAGCGMTLWTNEENAKPSGDRRFTLLSGLDENSTLMKINDEVVRFRRTEASGDTFYGQFTSQTFSNEEKGITVHVDVTQGQPGEIESLSIPSGTIKVELNGESVEVPVIGDAGC
ncbi:MULTISPECIES: hypothetical protein [unclassified Leptolyngbya]|uniref:hypothetical protein n=1 Tax=unclassified Leptolyngbya TaxID=2650499 RepID=UPI001684BF6A|nr:MULTISPECIES: hypothetical protein [unclassified Leptolyngbya]MBD1911515.1 hypothetical protein [Leptolyngbya sp. FACHB-8]MBD2155244.1 hypothetical protein [Leptolyngbya sp. FACHB-16]